MLEAGRIDHLFIPLTLSKYLLSEFMCAQGLLHCLLFSKPPQMLTGITIHYFRGMPGPTKTTALLDQ